MPNWTNTSPPPSTLSSENEARLELIRKLSHRLELLVGVLIGLAVLGSLIGVAIAADQGGPAAAFPVAFGGLVTLLVGVILYTAVRLICASTLFVCEYLAGL